MRGPLLLTPNDLAEVLERVYNQAESNNAQIVRSAQIKRADRELLVRLGWLQEIMQGWYMLVRPGLSDGDSTAWYANYWDFVRLYLNHHYKSQYCLSAESSIDLHLDKSVIPRQIIVICAKGGGQTRQLPYNTSILVYRNPEKISENVEMVKGINAMRLSYALCSVSPAFFRNSAQDAEIALRLVRDPAELLRAIITNKVQKPAARLIGAYQFLGDADFANSLAEGLKEQGFLLNAENPFEITKPFLSTRVRSPYVARILSMWQRYRDSIIELIPSAPGLPQDSANYMNHVQEIYKEDAYNSLSIEGYNVSQELIERVMQSKWSPDSNLEDAQERNALAARGYYEAFQQVKKTIQAILQGESPGLVMQNELSTWYQNLFGPMVRANILKTADLYGYRNDQVYIRNSRHTPLPLKALLDAMETFFECLQNEEHAGVRAILGHFMFVYIHPYMDGNGRIGRFLMNAMLASGGYPWTIIPVNHRSVYLSTLESASVEDNIIPFTQFVVEQMPNS